MMPIGLISAHPIRMILLGAGGTSHRSRFEASCECSAVRDVRSACQEAPAQRELLPPACPPQRPRRFRVCLNAVAPGGDFGARKCRWDGRRPQAVSATGPPLLCWGGPVKGFARAAVELGG